LGFLGVAPVRNGSAAAGAVPERVSHDAGAVQVWVVPTDEGGQIARELYDVLRSPSEKETP
jgi:hypothetical protein